MTPLLFADLAGADDPLRDLRAAAVGAIAELAEASDHLEALCPVGPGAPATYHHGGRSAPLAELVVEHLCALAGVAPPQVRERHDRAWVPPDPRTGLIVLGEGSARRLEGGPGGLDPRAEAVDARLVAALEAGDGEALLDLDEELMADLLVSGTDTFAALGRAYPRARGRLRWHGAPYGVTYVVATWRAPDADFGNPAGRV